MVISYRHGRHNTYGQLGDGTTTNRSTPVQVSSITNVTQVAQEGALQWVRMEPRRDDTDLKWVRLGFEGTVLRYMQLADKLGQTTQLELSKVERNPPLDPARFTFTVPPGADVIGYASSAAPAGKQ